MDSNPYIGYSTLATGPRFIGRHEPRRELRSMVASGVSSRAIVGLPRVGKSSLAKWVFNEASVMEGVSAVWLDVGTVATDQSLMEALREELTSGGQLEGLDEYGTLKAMLRANRRRGQRVVVVFDEFDAVRQTKEPTLSVRRLRELVIDPQLYGLTVLLVCRRDLETIEERIPDLSNLANACPTIRLREFSAEELAESVARGFVDGLPDESLQLIRTVTGCYPILVEQALMLLWDGNGIEEVGAQIEASAHDLVRQFHGLLLETEVWDELVSVARSGTCTFGPERERLLAYGVVSERGDGAYHVPFESLASSASHGDSPSRSAWVTDAT